VIAPKTIPLADVLIDGALSMPIEQRRLMNSVQEKTDSEIFVLSEDELSVRQILPLKLVQ